MEQQDSNAEEEGIPAPVKALRRAQQLYRLKTESHLARGEGREEQTLEMLAKFRARLLAVRGKGPVPLATDSTNVVPLTGPITELTTNLSTIAVIKESEPDTTPTTTPEDKTKPVTLSSDAIEAPDDDGYECVKLINGPVSQEQFEKESLEAHAEIERLKKENLEPRKENDKLRLFVFQLESNVEGMKDEVAGLRNKLSREVEERKALEEGLRRLTSQVDALMCDPILLEIREVLCNLEEKVVVKISQDPENTVLLSQVNFDDVAIHKWHTYCGLHRADLYAFSAMLQSVALARNKVALPVPKRENCELWKAELRNLCAKNVKTDSISNIINLAVQEL